MKPALGVNQWVIVFGLSAWMMAYGFEVQASGALPILQGASSESETEVVVAFPGPTVARVELQLESSKKLIPIKTQKEIHWPGVAAWLLKVRYSSLEQKKYILRVFDSNRELDRRTLKPLPKREGQVKFIVASCMSDDYPQEQKQIWEQVWADQPDALFLLGDHVYADWRRGVHTPQPSLDQILSRYIETRFALTLFRQETLIPVFVTWDDHDTGRDNANRETPDLRKVRDLFHDFFPSQSLGRQWTHFEGRTGGHLQWGSYEFHLMDDRSARVPPLQRGASSSEARSSHWGEGQEKLLLSHLKKSQKLHWILNGDEFFGGYAPTAESYEGDHPQSFAQTTESFKKSGSRFFLISGDRHFLELQKIEAEKFGFETYELTTSAIHAKVFPPIWGKTPNPRQIEGHANAFNYASIEATEGKEGWSIRVKGRGPAQVTYFDRVLQLSGKTR